MFRGLPTASLPVTKLFDSPYLFTVPAYQRPYSWTTKEAGQLLEDVVIAAGLDDAETAWPDYFLGTVLLLDPESDAAMPPPPFSGPRVFEVVDGQQRLVTLSILACVLRDAEDDEGRGEPAEASIADRLNAMVAVARDDRDITARSHRVHLRNGEQSYLEGHVLPRHCDPAPTREDWQPGASAIQAVHEHLAGEIQALSRPERRQLARYLMDDCHVVVIISRDIDRAHRLFTVLNQRGKPLERKDILKAEVLRSVPARSAQAALDHWEQAQARLGGEFEEFLAHLRLIHGYQKLPIIAGVRALVREYGTERFLSEQLTPLTVAFERVRMFASRPEAAAHPKLASALVSLNRIGKADWVPAAILAMAEFPSSPERATGLILEIERFVYLLRLLCYGSGKRQRRFNAVVAAIRTGGDEVLSSPAWQVTREESRTIQHHLKDIHKRNAQIAKLLLMRIEDEIAGTPMTVDAALFTVEHVLPLRPAATSGWRRLFPDAELRSDCQTSLGNLLLISTRQNDRAKNKDFDEKLAVYRELEAGLPVMASNREIMAAASWQVTDILAREAALMDLISRLWRLDLGAPLAGKGVGEPVAAKAAR
jgi:Protein of unknown function DUF262/Protein of unknown function (DUF1524)